MNNKNRETFLGLDFHTDKIIIMEWLGIDSVPIIIKNMSCRLDTSEDN
jgi:hypothetical protein